MSVTREKIESVEPNLIVSDGATRVRRRTRAHVTSPLRGAVTARIELTSLERLLDCDRADWRELARAQPESVPLLEPDWFESWVEAFTPADVLLLAAWEGERLCALAPLERTVKVWAGRRVRVIHSLTNAESYRYDFLCAPPRRDVLDALWNRLARSGADVIHLEHVPADSPVVTSALEAGERLGWRCHLLPTFESPWRPLRPPPAHWGEGLKSKFKSNLRNRSRRLAKLGRVTFDVVADPARQGDALEIFYALEAASWKGEAGTAVAQRSDARRLYDRWVERAAPRIRIALLSVGERPIAAQVLYESEDTLFMFKTAYDPEFSPYSPGQLLTAEVIRYGIDRGPRALDFLAGNMPWKSDWSPGLRPHRRVLLFAPTAAGQYAYWTRYGLRNLAKKVPGARQLADLAKRWRERP